MTRTGRPAIEASTLILALLLALTCRCAGTLQMLRDWSDMTKGSIHGANGVVAADEQCTREPSRAGKRKNGINNAGHAWITGFSQGASRCCRAAWVAF